VALPEDSREAGGVVENEITAITDNTSAGNDTRIRAVFDRNREMVAEAVHKRSVLAMLVRKKSTPTGDPGFSR